MHKLKQDFFERDNVVQISKELIGKVLFTCISGIVTSGVITETEAYNGIFDKASHAYKGRRTARTEIMYAKGGVSYVYLCYGIHNLFNIVTNTEDVPHAVLIRAIKPIDGIKTILKRRSKTDITKNICNGPGTVSQALGINRKHNGVGLYGNIIWLEDQNIKITDSKIIVGPRVGIDYAEEDALLPYRFKIIL